MPSRYPTRPSSFGFGFVIVVNHVVPRRWVVTGAKPLCFVIVVNHVVPKQRGMTKANGLWFCNRGKSCGSKTDRCIQYRLPAVYLESSDIKPRLFQPFESAFQCFYKHLLVRYGLAGFSCGNPAGQTPGESVVESILRRVVRGWRRRDRAGRRAHSRRSRSIRCR